MAAWRQNPPPRVLVLLGTRPEAIKLSPVIRELRRRWGRPACRVAATGQHQELAERALSDFGIEPDVRLSAMEPGQSLGRLSGRLLEQIDGLLASEGPDWVLVQGDTASAMSGAMAGFFRRVRVGHVEAGLRTGDRGSPFPEEFNREVITRASDLHFAPTERAASNLRAEGVPEGSILVTGNTAVDALRWICDRMGGGVPEGIGPEVERGLEGRRPLLVTVHRRESFGGPLEGICRGVREVVRGHPDVVVVWPMHPNPGVGVPVRELLGREPRVLLTGPLPYPSMVWLMRRCEGILTDSGGLQEEAPSLGKPLLILREATERPEAVESGHARLVGSGWRAIARASGELLSGGGPRSLAGSPFGDGAASIRIVEALGSRGRPG